MPRGPCCTRDQPPPTTLSTFTTSLQPMRGGMGVRGTGGHPAAVLLWTAQQTEGTLVECAQLEWPTGIGAAMLSQRMLGGGRQQAFGGLARQATCQAPHRPPHRLSVTSASASWLPSVVAHGTPAACSSGARVCAHAQKGICGRAQLTSTAGLGAGRHPKPQQGSQAYRNMLHSTAALHCTASSAWHMHLPRSCVGGSGTYQVPVMEEPSRWQGRPSAASKRRCPRNEVPNNSL